MSARDNVLLETSQYLARQLGADPRLCLATATAWLDPVWSMDEVDWDIPDDDEGALMVALRVLRRSFPDLYVRTIESIRRGDRFTDTERLICAEMYALDIPLDELHWLAWGIPMPAYGATLTDPEFYEVHADVVPVVGLFGIQPAGETRYVEVSDRACIAGRLVADSLMAQAEPHYQQLSWLLGWLFSWSGNTCVDLDYEALAEIELPPWEPEHVEMAQAIIAEAEDILRQAQAGLDWLKMQPPVFLALRKNVRKTLRIVEKRGGTYDHLTVRLHWPRLSDRADGAAESVAGVL